MKTRKIRISNICKINRATIDSKNKPESIKYLDTGNITKNKIEDLKCLELEKDKYPSRAKRLVKNNTIVYSNVRPNKKHYGILKNPDQNFIVSTGFTTLDVTDSDVDAQYLFYSIIRNDITNHLQRIGELGVTSYPSISYTDLADLELIIPSSLKQQRRIVKVLHDIDRKIDINEQIEVKLDELINQVYQFWFKKFSFPNENGDPYKKNGGDFQFSEELKSEIPKNWEVKRFGDLTEIVSESIDPSSFPNTKFKYYSIPSFDNSGSYEVETGSNIGSDKYIVDEKSLLISKLNPRFNRIIYPYTSESTICSTEFVVCKAKNQFLKNYLYAISKSKKFITYCINNTTGTSNSHKRVNPEIMMDFKIVYKKDVIERFGKTIDSFLRKKTLIQQQNRFLKDVRDWLLPMLMNGQVTVKEAEEELSIAAEPDTEYKATKKPTNVDYYRRTVLAAEIVWQLHQQPTLGHVKLQKIIYLAKHTSSMMLPTNFLKQAAGPYDPKMARSIDKQLKKNKWFEFHKGEFLKYKPLENAGEHKADFNKYFHEEKENIQFFIDTFKKAKTDKVEIIATLYACWKELTEKGKTVTDDVLIEQFYNWSEEKAKFKQERLLKAINWMRDEGVYPVS